jgi:hypothetical protein
MIEIAPDVMVGSADEYHEVAARLAENGIEFVVVHAAKEPWHRDALGYTGRAAPKDHPEYLVAVREGELCLNLIDADDPAYIPRALIDHAVRYIRDALDQGLQVLIHCNQGHSRGPVLAMLAVAGEIFGPLSFEEAETAFRLLYPPYDPKDGMRQFAINNWDRYRVTEALGAEPALG